MPVFSSKISRAVFAAGFMAFATGSGSAMATTITLDGIKDGNDNYAETMDTMASVEWYNGHQAGITEYGTPTTPLGTTTIHYGTHELAGGDGTKYFFLYTDIQIEAKQTIWDNGTTYTGGEVNIKATSDPMNPENDQLIDADIAPYRQQFAHHAGEDLVLGQPKPTADSEKVEILGAGTDGKNFKADWGETKTSNAIGLEAYKTSFDYVFDNFLCDADLCLERDLKFSFEFQFAADAVGETANTDLITAIKANGLVFHLSPERDGTAVVPLPAAFPLFGTGLAILGFLGWRRRRQAAAAV